MGFDNIDFDKFNTPIYPNGKKLKPHNFYMVVFKPNPWYKRPFFGKYLYGLMGLHSTLQSAQGTDGEWVCTHTSYKNPKDAYEELQLRWAIFNHPLRVWLYGQFKPEYIKLRSDWCHSKRRSFWET